MATNWHYAKNGEKHGPITATQLKELAKTGQLAPDDLVWREDMKEWRKAASVRGLHSEFPSITQAASVPRPTKSTSHKRVWLGIPVLILLIAVLTLRFLPSSNETPPDHIQSHATQRSGETQIPAPQLLPDQEPEKSPSANPESSEVAETAYKAGLDFGEGSKISPNSFLSFVGRITLPGGYRTHGEIRDARYAFTSNGTQFFMGAIGREAVHPLYLFDTQTGDMKLHIPVAHPRASIHGTSLLNLALSADGRMLVTGDTHPDMPFDQARTIRVWETISFPNQGRFEGATPKYEWSFTNNDRRDFRGEFLFQFSEDLTRLYFSVGITIGCLDLINGEMIYQQSVEWPVRGISRSRRSFWSLEPDGLHEWNFSDGKAVAKNIRLPLNSALLVKAFHSGDGEVQAVAVKVSGKGDKYECHLLDRDFSELSRITLTDYPRAATLSQDGKRLVISFEKHFVIFDCKTGQQLASVEGFNGRSVEHLCMSPDGSWLLTSSFTQGLYVFRIHE